MRKVPLHEAKDDLSKYLRDEDDWFEYRLEHNPRFLRRIAHARSSIAAGKDITFEEAGL